MSRWADNGYKSRKLWFAVFSIGTLFVGGFLLDEVLYGQFASGVVAIATILIAGNVTAKLVAGKNPETTVSTVPTLSDRAPVIQQVAQKASAALPGDDLP